eukprot:m.384895 g.384895  ORF g.384895 m.384895 type:complete len:109 (+) comp21001_c0_seq9:208-534(+)
MAKHTMKALVATAIGPFREVLKLQEIDGPEIDDECVVIAVESCGLAFPDVLTIEGKHIMKKQAPFVPGIDICGRVIEIGLSVKGIKLGDRVFGYCYRHIYSVSEVQTW